MISISRVVGLKGDIVYENTLKTEKHNEHFNQYQFLTMLVFIWFTQWYMSGQAASEKALMIPDFWHGSRPSSSPSLWMWVGPSNLLLTQRISSKLMLQTHCGFPSWVPSLTLLLTSSKGSQLARCQLPCGEAHRGINRLMFLHLDTWMSLEAALCPVKSGCDCSPGDTLIKAPRHLKPKHSN